MLMRYIFAYYAILLILVFSINLLDAYIISLFFVLFTLFEFIYNYLELHIKAIIILKFIQYHSYEVLENGPWVHCWNVKLPYK